MKYFLLLLAVLPLQAIRFPFMPSLFSIVGRVTPSNFAANQPIPRPRHNPDGTYSRDPIPLFIQGTLEKNYCFLGHHVLTCTPNNQLRIPLRGICLATNIGLGLAVLLKSDSQKIAVGQELKSF